MVEVPVAELDRLLDLPLWQRDGVRFQVRPRDVVADPTAYPQPRGRVHAADRSLPVHCCVHRGRLVILNAYHPLLGAVLDGDAHLRAMLTFGR